ncbi:MAG TPA: thioredoxin family protein [Bacteroidales bacterium]|nr:thioredoxin family protein [Bacteroidales bacterium]HOK74928.1 thioredoxin family protein [Bacteroidales bacterium]HOM39512.1 thioredoxin family protein [Bacteroidales bacterium]HOU31455.1 thioredoxin family protein [Bacteroidales bacterium]HPP91894.1 thioredoxin family protein [Bacteroidales bacterium]
MLEIKVLGTGCPNCKRLEDMCREVVAENNLDATIEKVSNIDEFWKYGVMLTPALIVNGKLLVQGKLPIRHTLVHWLMENK